MASTLVTVEEVRHLFSYNKKTGALRYRRGRKNKMRRGSLAGRISEEGYLRIEINNTAYSAHRVIWLLVHGEWPKNLIDHINGNPLDNRLSNLRQATVSENIQNLKGPRKDNKLGLLGVTYLPKRKLYQARISVGNKKVDRCQRFKTKEEAAAAYLEWKRELHPASTL